MPIKKPWESNITKIEKNKLQTYGYDQNEIIQSFSFEEMVYLLIFGKKPTRVEKNILRAVIVAYCSHGITGQSTLSVRMAVDCGSSFLNAAISGFSVGSGPFHQGALELSMKMLMEAQKARDITSYLENRLKNKTLIAGYGHRFHPRDPRAVALMQLCEKESFVGPYIRTAKEIESFMKRARGRSMNLGAAAGSILLDMGFPADVAFLIILIGRGPMYAAAYMERLRENNRPFPRIEVVDIKPGRQK